MVISVEAIKREIDRQTETERGRHTHRNIKTETKNVRDRRRTR